MLRDEPAQRLSQLRVRSRVPLVCQFAEHSQRIYAVEEGIAFCRSAGHRAMFVQPIPQGLEDGGTEAESCRDLGAAYDDSSDGIHLRGMASLWAR